MDDSHSAACSWNTHIDRPMWEEHTFSPTGDRLSPSRGALVAESYELKGLLGDGGMGMVWLADHRQLDIEVAVKFLLPCLVNEEDARKRFHREARAAARIKSRHVVRIHDFGVDRDTPFMVMERLVGESLAERLRRVQRLPLREVQRIAEHAARAVDAAHELEVLHRDLKPANIFMCEEDGEQVVKLLDFGVARLGSDISRCTSEGMILGSVGYMSPEQMRSAEVDWRADLWSLAVVLYRCLAGDVPFDSTQLLTAQEELAAPSVREGTPQLPTALDAFFARAFDLDPEGRFQSGAELAAAFTTALFSFREIADPCSMETDSQPSLPAVAVMAEVAPPRRTTAFHATITAFVSLVTLTVGAMVLTSEPSAANPSAALPAPIAAETEAPAVLDAEAVDSEIEEDTEPEAIDDTIPHDVVDGAPSEPIGEIAPAAVADGEGTDEEVEPGGLAEDRLEERPASVPTGRPAVAPTWPPRPPPAPSPRPSEAPEPTSTHRDGRARLELDY